MFVIVMSQKVFIKKMITMATTVIVTMTVMAIMMPFMNIHHNGNYDATCATAVVIFVPPDAPRTATTLPFLTSTFSSSSM